MSITPDIYYVLVVLALSIFLILDWLRTIRRNGKQARVYGPMRIYFGVIGVILSMVGIIYLLIRN